MIKMANHKYKTIELSFSVRKFLFRKYCNLTIVQYVPMKLI